MRARLVNAGLGVLSSTDAAERVYGRPVTFVPRAIPAELLARLAALDDRCDTSATRQTSDSFGPGRFSFSQRRVWHVAICMRREGHLVHAEDRSLAAALEKAVTEAERRWPARAS